MGAAADREEFVEIELVCGDRKVVWEYIGEGWAGDYDPDNPDDDPLLRFSCFKRTKTEFDSRLGVDEWEELPDSSYCTRMRANTPVYVLVMAVAEIMEAIYRKETYKRRLQELSWRCL